MVLVGTAADFELKQDPLMRITTIHNKAYVFFNLPALRKAMFANMLMFSLWFSRARASLRDAELLLPALNWAVSRKVFNVEAARRPNRCSSLTNGKSSLTVLRTNSAVKMKKRCVGLFKMWLRFLPRKVFYFPPCVNEVGLDLK